MTTKCLTPLQIKKLKEKKAVELVDYLIGKLEQGIMENEEVIKMLEDIKYILS